MPVDLLYIKVALVISALYLLWFQSRINAYNWRATFVYKFLPIIAAIFNLLIVTKLTSLL